MLSKNGTGFGRNGLVTLLGMAVWCGWATAVPSAHWIPVDAGIRPGEPVEIACRTEWGRDEPALDVLPVHPASLDWGTLQLLRTESGFDGDAVYVDQVFALTVAAPGTFTLPALEIPYLEGALAASEDTLMLEAPSLTLEVRPFNRALYVAGGAAFLTAILAFGFIVLRTRRTTETGEVAPDARQLDLDDAHAALIRAQKLRIDGDFYGCYQAMVESVSALGSSEQSLAAELSERAQAAGYGGTRPDNTLLDSDLRAVERAIARVENTDELDSLTTSTENEVSKT